MILCARLPGVDFWVLSVMGAHLAIELTPDTIRTQGETEEAAGDYPLTDEGGGTVYISPSRSCTAACSTPIPTTFISASPRRSACTCSFATFWIAKIWFPKAR